MTNEAEVLLATRDDAVTEAVQATALALGVPLITTRDREQMRQHWSGAPVRLVGADMAARAETLPGDRTFVVGTAGAELLAASAALRAPALALPQAAAQLAEVLTNLTAEESRSRVLAVMGTSGGVGASTLAAGLAVQAASRGGRAALVETAPCGGGADLLFGAETLPGLRWDALEAAAGELGQVAEHLVHTDGVDVLPLSRERSAAPGTAAVSAVLRSLGRTHDVVVTDAGPAAAWPSAETVLVVAADVRGVAAARMAVEAHSLGGSRLVVRTAPGRGLPPGAVAEALGMDLLGELQHDPAVPRLAASGASVVGARRFRRCAAQLWEALAL